MSWSHVWKKNTFRGTKCPIRYSIKKILPSRKPESIYTFERLHWNLPGSKEFRNIERYSPSSMFSVLRLAACGGYGILHSIFLTFALIVDAAVNMLFSSEVIFWTLSSSISFSYSLFTTTDVDKVSGNTSALLFTVTKLIPFISFSIFLRRYRLIFETSSLLRSCKR